MDTHSCTCWLSLFILLAVQFSPGHPSVLIYSSQNGVGLGRCLSSEFECSNGICINASSRCDGVDDCLDKTDELLCSEITNCRLGEYRCANEDTCFPFYTLCDGIEECPNGTDEMCPLPPDTLPCGYNQFFCDGDCMPYAYLCDGVQHCSNGEDESECGLPSITFLARNVSVLSSESITLTCLGTGYPPPFVSWRRNLEPLRPNSRYQLVSSAGVGTLTIDNAQAGDAGEYSCELQSRLYGNIISEDAVLVSVLDENPSICRDELNQAYMQGEYYYSTRFFASGPASEAAADIIFVVDESGSMAMEHAWIQREVFLLDQALKERGVGAGTRQNLFGLVGFGRNDFSAIGGLTLSELAPPEDFITAAGTLQLTGVLEDGYSAIEHALTSIQTRPDTAKQLILVTDEDRGVLRPDLSRDIIQQLIADSGFMLNVIINQGFLSDPLVETSFALGLGANGISYVLNTNSQELFSLADGGAPNFSPFFSFGDSFADYGSLAHSTGGAAWDLNQLREQGVQAEAFTNAFTTAKVEEVMSVLQVCVLCVCQIPEEQCVRSNRSIEQCFGSAQVLSVHVVPRMTLVTNGSQVDIECVTVASPPNTSYSINWDYPSGSQVVTQENMLSVTKATTESEGLYTCTATIDESQLQFSAAGSLALDTRCKLDDGTYLIRGESRQVLSSRGTNRTRAADVILLVDESGSMSMEHAWIPSMIEELDNSLQNFGVGIDRSNYFGVVGFGEDCSNELNVARVLSTPSDQFFVTAGNISQFTMNLSVGGRREDGYSAINAAIESYQFRDGAKLFILITDEDRDVLDANLTRANLSRMLQDQGIVLNTVVSEEYSGNEQRGLGIDTKGNAFIYDPSSRDLFRVIENQGSPIQDSAHGTTNLDYTQIALEQNGASWDISLLRQGGRVADAFTQAFVSVKVLEARAQMEDCLECMCTADGTVCEPTSVQNTSCRRFPVPPLPGESPFDTQLEYNSTRISPGQSLSVLCRVNCSGMLHWTFNGADLPMNVMVTERTSFTSTLTIVNGSRDNAGVYACLAQSASETYNDIVAVNTEFYDPQQDLMLELTPLEANFPRGGDNELLCSVENPATFEWRFNNGPLLSNVLVVDSLTFSTLTISSTNDTNSGAYTCVANNTGQGVINTDTAYIEVVDPGIRASIVNDLLEVALSSSAELICQYTSDFPSARVEWRRPANEPLPTQAEVRRTSSDISLFIPSVSLDDGGRYICSVEAGDQLTESSAYISVQIPEPEFVVILTPSMDIIIPPGTNQSVVCDANRNTTSFVWFFNGFEVQVQGAPQLTNNSAPINVVVVPVSERRSTLTVLASNDENTGEYQCMAISSDGNSASESLDITVQ